MIIDISSLKSFVSDYVKIDEVYSFSKDELKSSEIMELNDLRVNGYIRRNSLNDYEINILLEGVMVLPCSVTLKPVNHNFSTEINGNLEDVFEEFGENYENNQKTIDILPIIWENILMEIPIKVVSDDVSDVKVSGNGWELITDDDEKVNPNLAKLKDLL